MVEKLTKNHFDEIRLATISITAIVQAVFSPEGGSLIPNSQLSYLNHRYITIGEPSNSHISHLIRHEKRRKPANLVLDISFCYFTIDALCLNLFHTVTFNQIPINSMWTLLETCQRPPKDLNSWTQLVYQKKSWTYY